MITKMQLKNLYGRWTRQDPYTDHALRVCARAVYPKVSRLCTWEKDGKRRWMLGGTPALKRAMSAFRAFVEAWESNQMTFQAFDGVIWACHNNGVFADVFISDCHSESEAIKFLNGLGGIER